MKVFVYKFFLFLLPLALLVFAMEKGLSRIPNSYSVKKKNFEREAPGIELLILGSSHAYFDIDPELLGCRAFNMANASQSIYYDTGIVRRYLPEMKQLRVVLFTLSYFSFGFQLADSREDWRCFYYERYYDIPLGEKRRSDFLELRKYSPMALYGGKESFNYMRKGFKVNLAEHVQPNGWFASEVPLGPINAETGRKRVQSYHADMRMENYPRNFQRLDDLFRLLREKGIEPVIITPPVYETCFACLDPAGVRKMEETIDSLCIRHRVRYFNYLKDRRFVLADFSDNDHLNPQGAAKFTRILNVDVLNNRTTEVFKSGASAPLVK